MSRTTTLVFALAAVLTASTANAAEFVVIVNPLNPTSTIGKSAVARLFLKQTPLWEHGEKAVPVDLDSRSEVRADFTTAVLKRTVPAVVAYWNQKVFSGAEVPPMQKTSDAQVLEFVRANPGAIGYVSAATVTAAQRVKVLRVVE